MTRVSDNSIIATVNNSFNKTKGKLEDLQRQGMFLKKVSRPSDDPVGNIEVLRINSSTSVNKQYMKNADHAILNLNHIESALEHITDILQKVKEAVIAQSSGIYGPHIRKNIASEIIQIKKDILSIANKRIGQRYIFGGYKSLSRPFDEEGIYSGDNGKVQIEVNKDFLVPINLNGYEVFSSSYSLPKNKLAGTGSSQKNIFANRINIFGKLDSLIVALENDDVLTIQGLIEKFDEDITRIISLRTQIGSIMQAVEKAKDSAALENLSNAERKSLLVDADVAELFTDIEKHKNILQASYKASQTMLNKNLLDFL